ncbi:MAG: hypothetical protein WCC87_10400 [Candidatus Korobacteraceae bacterium]
MSNLRRYLSADGENASVSDPFHGILITMETRPREFWLVTTSLIVGGTDEFSQHFTVEYGMN